jgi:pimeloyl-ACP methyl ester carboxylesterase
MSSAIENGYIVLTTKPKARLSYSFVNSKGPTSHPGLLIVFLNGLGLSQSSWLPTIEGTMANRSAYPAMLTYDRYGHGSTTDRDPLDDPSHGHTCKDVMHDLHQLITQISATKLSHSNLRLFFVASSIGCAIARLYAQEYPATVAALLLLDSIVANSDYVSMVPDPDFTAAGTAAATDKELRATRAKFAALYHPSTGTHGKAEGLDRLNLAEMLPHAHLPVLEGRPWVTVAQHDVETLAAQSLDVSMLLAGREIRV